MRFMLDTGIAGDYINRRQEIDRKAQLLVREGHRIGISYPTLAELRYGVENSRSSEQNRKLLNRTIPDFVLWPLTIGATDTYAPLATQLRKVGRKVPAMDLLIPAIAMNLNDCVVVSADTDLYAIPGLRVLNWQLPDEPI